MLGKVVAATTSRQKGKFRFTFVDETNKVTSFLRDGKKDDAAHEIKDITGSIAQAKPLSHSILF